jgi:mannose-6-phosphate isomerase-like protein (cupin superfamily)
MRRIVLGVDENGCSCIAEQSEMVGAPISALAGTSTVKLFSTNQSPPPPVAKGHGRFIPDGLPPGHVNWYMIEHAPRGADQENKAQTALHHRDVIDLILIIDGSASLLLDDGAYPVSAGDCIVMEGTDHGFRPGTGGCRLMAYAIGAQRR